MQEHYEHEQLPQWYLYEDEDEQLFLEIKKYVVFFEEDNLWRRIFQSTQLMLP